MEEQIASLKRERFGGLSPPEMRQAEERLKLNSRSLGRLSRSSEEEK